MEGENMSLINCNYKCNCAIAAIIVGAIIGIVTAFLQITGVIVITPVALTVAFGIAVVYLGVLLIAGGQADRSGRCSCTCDTLNVLLAGILGTIALSVILLGFGIVATSVISAHRPASTPNVIVAKPTTAPSMISRIVAIERNPI